MHTTTRSALLAGLLTASASATAIEYTLPTGGYYQLQRTDTYETVCQSGARCDVPAGTYTLLDFTESPARRSRVTIGGGRADASDADILATIRRNVRTVESTCGPGTPICRAACPAGRIAIDIACNVLEATGLDAAEQPYVTDRDVRGGTGACRTPSRAGATITTTLVCL